MGGLGVGLAIATLGFFVVLALSRATLLLKLKKMMKARKLIWLILYIPTKLLPQSINNFAGIKRHFVQI